MNIKYSVNLSSADLEKIKNLNALVANIKKLFDEYQYNLEASNQISRIKKQMYNDGEKFGELKYYKELCDEALIKSFDNYTTELNEWNDKMKNISNNYHYLTLREFMNKNILLFSTSQPNLLISIYSRDSAEANNIPILRLLLSGKPKFVNMYPEKWLNLLYKI